MSDSDYDDDDDFVIPAPPLPDEIVKRFLEPLLDVPDNLYANVDKVSPFSIPSKHKSSDYLLVCKQWMRVATPLLYHTVILRSKAQVLSLERTLKENRDLGRWIRKFRVEGGFGASIYTIIVASPNIKELFLSMELWSDDNVSGLVKALPLVRPVRVILKAGVDDKLEPMVNKGAKNLMAILCNCIENKWSTLKSFYFPYNTDNSNTQASRISFREALAASLARSSSLTTLEVCHSFLAESLETIARNENLRRILIKSAPGKLRPQLDPFLKYDSEGMEEDEWYDDLYNSLGDRGQNQLVHRDERLRSLAVYEEQVYS